MLDRLYNNLLLSTSLILEDLVLYSSTGSSQPLPAFFLVVGVFISSLQVNAQILIDDVVPIDVTLDTLFAIGSPTGPEDEFISRDRRGGPVIFDVGPDGLIWIMNSGDKHMMVFNEDGERQAFLGRSGAGPGEFQWVMGLKAVEGGAWTWDWRNQQLCNWLQPLELTGGRCRI